MLLIYNKFRVPRDSFNTLWMLRKLPRCSSFPKSVATTLSPDNCISPETHFSDQGSKSATAVVVVVSRSERDASPFLPVKLYVCIVQQQAQLVWPRSLSLVRSEPRGEEGGRGRTTTGRRTDADQPAKKKIYVGRYPSIASVCVQSKSKTGIVLHTYSQQDWRERGGKNRQLSTGREKKVSLFFFRLRPAT